MYAMSYVRDSVYLYDLFKRHPVPGVLLAHTRPTMFYIHLVNSCWCARQKMIMDTYNLTPH